MDTQGHGRGDDIAASARRNIAAIGTGTDRAKHPPGPVGQVPELAALPGLSASADEVTCAS